VAKKNHIQLLINKHAEMLDGNPYCYFELAYTRQTEWMAWICSKPREMDPGRIVHCSGQGMTPDDACKHALSVLEKAEAAG
jgi:hypothetical protein